MSPRRRLDEFVPHRLETALAAADKDAVCRSASITRQTLNNWLSGASTPEISSLRIVAATLDRSVVEFLDLDPEPTLAQLRLAAGLSKSELAQRAGLSADTVRQLETGTARLLDHHLAKLAAALGLAPTAVRAAYQRPR
ncbi:helix-turn-helix domain-containing protein [Nocardia takedensis]|uniref:helix-turn-helix domain-containing protein n=1 Tax=Nocardia takedensis TaxID=259390 RepID=UPI003F7628CB